MTTWRNLGTLTPRAFEWNLFNEPTEFTTFRISFVGDVRQIWYYLRIRQYFYSDSVSLSQKLYPKSESIIIQMPIPQELLEAGLYTRFIGVAKFPIRQYTIADSNWQVTLEELV